jgi:hypothetical protein
VCCPKQLQYQSLWMNGVHTPDAHRGTLSSLSLSSLLSLSLSLSLSLFLALCFSLSLSLSFSHASSFVCCLYAFLLRVTAAIYSTEGFNDVTVVCRMKSHFSIMFLVTDVVPQAGSILEPIEPQASIRAASCGQSNGAPSVAMIFCQGKCLDMDCRRSCEFSQGSCQVFRGPGELEGQLQARTTSFRRQLSVVW